MEAKLNIYASCTSDEPTKTYVCKRLIYKVVDKLEAISEKAKKTKDKDEQIKYTLETLQTIFPDFSEEDLEYMDVNEYFAFMSEIAKETNKLMSNAAKN